MNKDIVLDDNFNPGWIPDPLSEKDALMGAFPESLGAAIKDVADFSIPKLALPIKNQDGFPSCVGQAIARYAEYLNFKEGRDIDIIMSGRDVFSQSKKLDGYPNIEGTFFRCGMTVWMDKGIVPDKLYPERHDISYQEYVKPYSDREPGERYKIKGFVKALSLEEGIRFVNTNKIPIIMGINGNNASWSHAIVDKNNNIIPPWNTTAGKNWGHAILLIGKKTIKGVICAEIENSWDKTWGDKGRAYIPITYTGIQPAFYGAYDLPNNWKETNIKYRSKIMWDKISVIKAVFGFLELFGHPPYNDKDGEIHSKATTPEEMMIGLKQYVADWINKNISPNVDKEELKTKINNIIEESFKK